MTTRDLLDDDGENQAVRAFLQVFSMTSSISVWRMREHLDAYGFPHWPEWAAAPNSDLLTKSGAQDWLRHLFALEQAASAAPKGEAA